MASSSPSKAGQVALIAALAGLLAACDPNQEHDLSVRTTTFNTATQAPAPQVIFDSETYGVELAYPQSGVHITDDRQGYFATDGWTALAAPNEDGVHLLSLTLDESNRMMSGGFRLGVSEDDALRKACTQVPEFARDDGDDTTTLDGVVFTTFTSGDAAMNHFQTVRSYRALHQERCYAIDLVVNGTNPEVYDPPRQPPFQRDQALDRLETLLVGLRFKDG